MPTHSNGRHGHVALACALALGLAMAMAPRQGAAQWVSPEQFKVVPPRHVDTYLVRQNGLEGSTGLEVEIEFDVDQLSIVPHAGTDVPDCAFAEGHFGTFSFLPFGCLVPECEAVLAIADVVGAGEAFFTCRIATSLDQQARRIVLPCDARIVDGAGSTSVHCTTGWVDVPVRVAPAAVAAQPGDIVAFDVELASGEVIPHAEVQLFFDREDFVVEAAPPQCEPGPLLGGPDLECTRYGCFSWETDLEPCHVDQPEIRYGARLSVRVDNTTGGIVPDGRLMRCYARLHHNAPVGRMLAVALEMEPETAYGSNQFANRVDPPQAAIEILAPDAYPPLRRPLFAVGCPGDTGYDGEVTVDELIGAVNLALQGCPPPGPRFVDRGDGTIYDAATGLLWAKKSNDGSVHDADNEFTYCADADGDELCDGGAPVQDGTYFTAYLDVLNAASFAGYDDWRMPALSEMLGVVDWNRIQPALDPIFTGECPEGCSVTECACENWTAFGGQNWTLTDFIGNAEGILAINSGQGSFGFYSGVKATYPLRGRAVRDAGDVPCPADASGDGAVTVDEIVAAVSYALEGCGVRFHDLGNGSLRDAWTGLVWENKTNDESLHGLGTRFVGCEEGDGSTSCEGTGPLYDEFIDVLNGSAFAGASDWRLPTVPEALSLAAMFRDPSVDAGVFDVVRAPDDTLQAMANCPSVCTVESCRCGMQHVVMTAEPGPPQACQQRWRLNGPSLSLRYGRNDSFRARAVRGPS